MGFLDLFTYNYAPTVGGGNYIAQNPNCLNNEPKDKFFKDPSSDFWGVCAEDSLNMRVHHEFAMATDGYDCFGTDEDFGY